MGALRRAGAPLVGGGCRDAEVWWSQGWVAEARKEAEVWWFTRRGKEKKSRGSDCRVL